MIISLAEHTKPGYLPPANVSNAGLRYKSEYQNDDLKRVLFVLDASNSKEVQETLGKEVPILSEGILEITGQRVSKFFFMDDMHEFEKRYPLVCLPF